MYNQLLVLWFSNYDTVTITEKLSCFEEEERCLPSPAVACSYLSMTHPAFKLTTRWRAVRHIW